MVKPGELQELLAAPRHFAAVAYNQSNRTYVPMIFKISIQETDDGSRNYALGMSFKQGLESLEAAIEKINSAYVGGFDTYAILGTHVLSIAEVGMIDHVRLNVAGFSKDKQIEFGNIKAVNLWKGEAKFVLPSELNQTGVHTPGM